MRWLDGIIDLMDVSLSELREMVILLVSLLLFVLSEVSSEDPGVSGTLGVPSGFSTGVSGVTGTSGVSPGFVSSLT